MKKLLFTILSGLLLTEHASAWTVKSGYSYTERDGYVTSWGYSYANSGNFHTHYVFDNDKSENLHINGSLMLEVFKEEDNRSAYIYDQTTQGSLYLHIRYLAPGGKLVNKRSNTLNGRAGSVAITPNAFEVGPGDIFSIAPAKYNIDYRWDKKFYTEIGRRRNSREKKYYKYPSRKTNSNPRYLWIRTIRPACIIPGETFQWTESDIIVVHPLVRRQNHGALCTAMSPDPNTAAEIAEEIISQYPGTPATPGAVLSSNQQDSKSLAEQICDETSAGDCTKYTKQNGNSHTKIAVARSNPATITSDKSTVSADIENSNDLSGNYIDIAEESTSDTLIQSSVKAFFTSLNYGAHAVVKSTFSFEVKNGETGNTNGQDTTKCIKRVPNTPASEFNTAEKIDELANIECGNESLNSADLIVLFDENGNPSFATKQDAQNLDGSKQGGVVVNYINDKLGEQATPDYSLELSIETNNFKNISERYISESGIGLKSEAYCYVGQSSLFETELIAYEEQDYRGIQTSTISLASVNETSEFEIPLTQTRTITCEIFTDIKEQNSGPRNKATNIGLEFDQTINLKLKQKWIQVVNDEDGDGEPDDTTTINP